MHPERRTGTEKERLIKVQFVYDPNFTPLRYSKGEIDFSSHVDQPPSLYAKQRSEEWNNQISSLISRAFDKVLGHHEFPSPMTCLIVKYRIKASENLFLEASSDPLFIWAIPPDDKWGYLAFHARLTHELVHGVGLRPFSNWDILADEVRRKNLENPEFFKQENYAYREELIVRHTTYKITKEVWNQEFADWFLARESKVIPAQESSF